jgi:RNA 3'-terminal phosphate cyclase
LVFVQTILPSVANLCNDAETSVRLRAVQVLGSIVSSSSADKVLEPVLFQLDALIESGVSQVLEATMIMLTEVAKTKNCFVFERKTKRKSRFALTLMPLFEIGSCWLS